MINSENMDPKVFDLHEGKFNDEQINIVDKILVPHTAVQNAIKRIERCYITAKDSVEPICILLIGEARTGKTRVLDFLESKHPKYRLDDGLRVPILKVTTPSNPTVKALAEVLLNTLGDPTPGKGTETNMTIRLNKLLKAAEVRIIIVDEFQHFHDKQSNKVMHHVTDWLKTLIDESKVALVVGGLPSCQTVLNQNEQLAGRFLGQIEMPRFDWMNENSRDEFIQILDAFEEALVEYQMPKLTTDEMAFRFYCATGGLMGYLVKLLRQAVWNAIFEDTKIINMQSLKIAYQESIYQDKSKVLPPAFDKGFTTQINEELMKTVRAIGVQSADAPVIRGIGKKKQNLSATQILRAR